MAVTRVISQDVATQAVDALGLDASTVGLMFTEGLAASLRRAASFLCPTTPGALVRAVTEALSGLPEFTDDARAELEALVDLLVSYGDLLELELDDDQCAATRLFLGPPSYIVRDTGTCLLLGVRPEGAPLVSEELLKSIEYEGHVRRVRAADEQRTREVLHIEGLVELQLDQWLKPPRYSTPADLLAIYQARLETAPAAYEVEGLRVIDPASAVTYYKGRWRPPKRTDRGLFVARRPRAFGADLWCVALIGEGSVRIIDLPLQSGLSRGSDEAWRLQAALDVLAGQSQRLRTRAGARPEEVVLDFFSPLPSWLQRRLDLFGTPLIGGRGVLFSYAMPQAEVEEELEFLKAMMWLDITKG